MDAGQDYKAFILIVDDNITNLHLLTQILSQNAYKTHLLTRSVEALDVARETLPDLILLDIMMPELDGFEVCEQLKEDAITQHIPVIFISARKTTGEKVKAFQVGGVDFITKPFQIDEVLMRVTTHLSIRQLQTSLEAELAQREQLIAELNSTNVHLQTEIADRERIEAALELSREHFRTVSDFTYNWELWIGSRGYPIYISPSCHRITGYRREEFQKEPGLLTSIVHPEDRAMWIKHLNLDLSSQDIFSFNLRVITRGGEERWIGHTCQPVYNGSGEWVGRRASNRDITEQIRAEARLRQYAAELEAQNAELDAFAHTVAHDLKNPLAALTGFSYVLTQRARSCQQEQIASDTDMIRQGIQKVSTIVDELLLLSSVRKLTEVEILPLDMAAIVTEAKKRMATQLKQTRGELILPQSWPVAHGYAPWIEEVWANYLSNALQYGGTPPRVELGWDKVKSVPNTPRDPPYLRFWVQDNGPGLTLEQQEQLFTQFTRLHQERAKGHGLGLSIVQRIVTRLGGEVGVESAPKQGSLFFFTLPQNAPTGAMSPAKRL